jgi:hypothetical protein
MPSKRATVRRAVEGEAEAERRARGSVRGSIVGEMLDLRRWGCGLLARTQRSKGSLRGGEGPSLDGEGVPSGPQRAGVVSPERIHGRLQVVEGMSWD